MLLTAAVLVESAYFELFSQILLTTLTEAIANLFLSCYAVSNR